MQFPNGLWNRSAPWVINGWQSYGRFGNRPGLGEQILYRPKPWLSLVFNNYGMGEDTLTFSNPPLGRSRIHTDDSIEVKYYDNSERTLDKMAFTLTGDLGCEYGGGVSCFHNTKTTTKQMFSGWMLYNRFWFKKDLFGLPVGGGVLDNPGRYLTLHPPVNGADAVSGSPYFTANPGDPYKAWDASVTFDWMPRQHITFRSEYGYRRANQPYFTGRGGITPPGGNTGTPGSYICTNGASSVASSFAPTGSGFAVDNSGGAVQTSCASRHDTPLIETNVLHDGLYPALRALNLLKAGLHAFRHGCNRRWELAGLNPAVHRQQMGHSSAAMTARYTGEIPLQHVRQAFSGLKHANWKIWKMR